MLNFLIYWYFAKQVSTKELSMINETIELYSRIVKNMKSIEQLV